MIRGIVSDEDTKLLKASRLLGQHHLPDISHAIASCLRKTLEKDSTYQLLIKQITNYQAKSVNQDLTVDYLLTSPEAKSEGSFYESGRFCELGVNHAEKI